MLRLQIPVAGTSSSQLRKPANFRPPLIFLVIPTHIKPRPWTAYTLDFSRRSVRTNAVVVVFIVRPLRDDECSKRSHLRSPVVITVQKMTTSSRVVNKSVYRAYSQHSLTKRTLPFDCDATAMRFDISGPFVRVRDLRRIR